MPLHQPAPRNSHTLRTFWLHEPFPIHAPQWWVSQPQVCIWPTQALRDVSVTSSGPKHMERWCLLRHATTASMLGHESGDAGTHTNAKSWKRYTASGLNSFVWTRSGRIHSTAFWHALQPWQPYTMRVSGSTFSLGANRLPLPNSSIGRFV